MAPATAGLNRRNLLLGAAAVGVFGTGCGTACADSPSLGAIAASKGVLFGSLMRLPSLTEGGAYARMMTEECKLYVCAEMHWRLVSPRPDVTDFSKVDQARAWARAHGMPFRGHSLLWHLQTPTWFGELSDRAAAVAALQGHIRTMCTHFAGTMQSWDVVNEALVPNGGENGLRRTVFLEKIGPEYLDIAFHAAREADGKALLVLNDAGMEYDFPGSRRHRRFLLDLVDGFKRRNTPIDAIGIQSHLATESSTHLSDVDLDGFLREISDRGLKILVTELDVIDRGSPSDIAKRDTEVAAMYKRYLEVVLENKAVVAVATWGLTDHDSWITRGDLPAFRRADGLPARPLPFDDHYVRKPAYFAIAEAFKAAPAR
jgi:endo-1,4-beta-xylanase